MNLLKKALVIASSAMVIGASTLLPAQKASAWQSYEHLVEVKIPNGLNQSQADSWCTTRVHDTIAYAGGNFSDTSHGGVLAFFIWSRPYVWAHLSLKKCVINATSGYIQYGHP
jgi:hypothetical protein